MKLPTFESELGYALEKFLEENDREPTLEERRGIEGLVACKIASMEEALAEWEPNRKHYRD